MAVVLRNIQDNTEGAQSRDTIATDVRRSTVAYIQEHAGEFLGVKIAERTERQYHPYGETACHILGYTGTITSEQLEAQNKENLAMMMPLLARLRTSRAISWARRALRATTKTCCRAFMASRPSRSMPSGNVTGQAGAVPAKAGSDIKLTLDLKIQQACETALASAIELAKTTGYSNAGNGAVVCLDPNNGGSRAWQASPSLDPSVFIGGVSNDVWTELTMTRVHTRRSTAPLAGQYMSASTIKPLSALAGLEFEPTLQRRQPTARAIGRPGQGLGQALLADFWSRHHDVAVGYRQLVRPRLLRHGQGVLL